MNLESVISIDHSKQNLDTQLGYWFDEGKQISFGEWQKLAIARTFSKDADVIFLDDPILPLMQFLIMRFLSSTKSYSRIRMGIDHCT